MNEPAPPPRNINISALNKDWKIIKLLNWTGVPLAAATPYDFSTQKLVNLQAYQYYSAAIMVLTTLGFVYSLIGRHLNVYIYMNLTTITMDVLSLTVVTIFNLIVVGVSAFNSKYTENLLSALIKNDMFLQPKQKQKSNGKCELRFQVRAIILHAGFFALTIYDSYVRLGVFGSYSLRYYLFKNFQCYIFVFVTITFCEGLKFLQSRFKFSTKILLDLVDQMHKFPHENEEKLNQEFTSNKWIRVSQKIKPRQEDVMQLKLLSKIFDALFDAVELFSKIFEWQMFCIMFTTVIEIVQLINFLIAYGSGVLQSVKIANVPFIVLRVVWTIQFLVLSILVIAQSVNLKGETRRITITLNKRLLEMPCEELLRDEAVEELTVLNQQFMHRPLDISGTFFCLDLGFVLKTVLTITSFIPVVIQFNRI